MKQAWWKRALSYVKDVHIESVESEVNPGLQVLYSRGRYQLCVNNAIYSFEDKYDNFWDSFELLDKNLIQDKDFLILGFGMGSIPRMLEKKGIIANFTGVEVDENVIYLFQKYMADEIESPITMITADAFMFLNLNELKYDFIAMDVFVEDVIPSEYLQADFLQMLSNSLTEDGLLIWNHLYHFEKDREKTNSFFEKVFKKTFNDASFIQTRGNKMLLNKKIVNSQPKKK